MSYPGQLLPLQSFRWASVQAKLHPDWGPDLCESRRCAHSPIGVLPMSIVNILRGLPCRLESLRLKFTNEPSFLCGWGFGWVDKAQCFRSARRFGAGSSPDFSWFSRHLASWHLKFVLLFSCTTMSYPGQVLPLREKAMSGNELLFLDSCPAYLFSEKQNSCRDRASWSSQHQQKVAKSLCWCQKSGSWCWRFLWTPWSISLPDDMSQADIYAPR